MKENEVGILNGKTAVVTGSTSGIGFACARAFAAAGANIVLNGIGAPADIEKGRSAIEKEFGVTAIYSPADMSEPSEIAQMIVFAKKTFGVPVANLIRTAISCESGEASAR
jgi:3-hydroxybutyrate dehydrogenase